MAGLYIHIPFCISKCAYCDFYSAACTERIGDYTAALGQEMSVRQNYLGDAMLDTVYFGGGTPSLMATATVRAILDNVRRFWNVSPDAEITLEANPDDLSGGYLAGLAATGVNRLSIGVQSFADRHLRFMGRRHDALAAASCIAEARRAEFGNISIDLIYGIPGMSPDEWRDSVARAAESGARHISAYCLMVEEGTPLHARLSRGEFAMPPDAEIEHQYCILREILGAAGFEHYEVSNFALPDWRSRHNSSYWSGESYLGLGPSAHSYDGRTRSWSPASLDRYLEAPGSVTTEVLDAADRYNEYVMTRLRTSDGVDADELESLFGREQLAEFLRCAERHVTSGNFSVSGSRYAVPPSKFLISDGVIRDFFDIRE